MKRILLLGLLAAGAARAEPWLETEVTPREPYVQQQVRYRVILYRDSHLQQGDFFPPEIPGVLVVPGQATAPRSVVHDGRTMERLEQSWLLFPQHSGTLQLPAPLFSGRDFFLRGRPETIEVKPPPPEWGPWPWLVTDELHLEVEWNGSLEGLAPGDARIREVRLRGRALTGAQLPRLEPAPVAGFEIQPLPERVSHHFEGGELWGERRIRHRYLAVAPGRGRLPDLVVHWWSPEKAQVMESRRPGPAYAIQGPPAAEPPPDHDAPPAPDRKSPPERPLPWAWGLLGLGGLLLTGWIWKRHPRAAEAVGRLLPWLWIQLRLLLACLRNDPCRAHRLSMSWDPPPPAGDPLWRRLDAACYGPPAERTWSGRRAWWHLARRLPLIARRPGSRRSQPLPPLWEESSP